MEKKRYGKNWDKIRKKVYSRDGYRCAACGATNVKLNAHHIIMLRISNNNDLRNLITLCDKCHKILESKSIKLLKSGGHRNDVIRLAYRFIIESRAKRNKKG